MKISDLLIKDRISLDVKSTTKVDIIKELARLHEKTGVLNDYDGYVEALMAREAQSSTGIGEGIAIPHAKTKYVKKPALAMGRKPEGIDYDSLDEEPATLFFMIAAPDGANNTHIETLARFHNYYWMMISRKLLKMQRQLMKYWKSLIKLKQKNLQKKKRKML